MRESLKSLKALAIDFFEWPAESGREVVTLASAILFAEHVQQRELTELRALHAEMVGAEQAYNKADPLDVHHAHAAMRASRFRYARAAGEYVAVLLDGGK